MDQDTRFGVFLAPFHALNEPPDLLFARDLELMETLDRLGFDEAWIGEHHSGGFETIAAPEIFIGAAAERTRRIRLGTGVKSLPYHNPFMLAESMVQLDHMTRGRVMLGVGPGALPSDAAMIGVDARDTRRMMDEALEAIVPLLEGERVTMETDWFTLRDAKLHLGSYTRPRMEMAVTTVRSPAGSMTAGRFGLGLLSLGGTSDDALKAYDDNWKICEETAAAHGRTVDRRNFRVAVLMHLAPTREQAMEEVRHGINKWAGYTQDVLPFGPVPRGVEDVASFVAENQRAVIGTPDDVIRHLEHAQAGAGGIGVIMMMAHDWATPEATRNSYTLFARHVMPHFQGRLSGRRESYDRVTTIRSDLQASAEEGVEAAKKRYEETRR